MPLNTITSNQYMQPSQNSSAYDNGSGVDVEVGDVCVDIVGEED